VDGVLLEQQLRTLCLETEIEKRKNKRGVNRSLSVPLGKGGRVRAGCRIGRLDLTMGIVCICTYVWRNCF